MARNLRAAAEAEQPQAEQNEALPEPSKTEEKLRREAYSAAQTRLREEQKPRFRELVLEEAAKRGVTYEFRKSEEEKAREQIQALLAKHPELASEVQQQG